MSESDMDIRTGGDTMTEYNLINPSDPYTFLAKTKESAALAVFLLGTMYGASPKDDDEEKRIPVCFK